MKKTKRKNTGPEGGERDESATSNAAVASQSDAVDESPATDGEFAPDTIEGLRQQVEKLSDNLLRAKADFQNLQRRGAVERADAIRFANAELMKSLLGVIDDFDRSLAATQSSDNLSAVVDGVRLVHENFLQALRAQGLEVIESLHQPFDPSVHEALLQQPSTEHPPGTVIEQVAAGYRLRDRVLRPAKVIVSAAEAPKPSQPSDELES